jgi:hypothetical protein
VPKRDEAFTEAEDGGDEVSNRLEEPVALNGAAAPSPKLPKMSKTAGWLAGWAGAGRMSIILKILR